MAYSDVVLADSPVRYWKLDDATGVDTQGNGNLTKGSSTNAPTTGQAGQSGIGSSWYFDGGDFASFAMPSLSTTMTFEMFFKSDAANKGSHTFMRFDGASVGVIRMQGDGSVYPGEIYGVIGGAEFRSTTRYDDNNWHHLAVVVSGTSVKVYVDKVLKSDLTNGSASYSFAATGYLGRDMANTANEYLIGGLDEVAIYNTALAPTRIAAHYDARAIVPTANATFTATPATATGTAPDAKYVKSITSMVTADARIGESYSADATLTVYGTTIGSVALKAPVNLPEEATVYAARLWFYVEQGYSDSLLNVRKITSAWSESSASSVTAPLPVLDGVTVPAIGWYSVNITAAASAWAGGEANHGIRLDSGATGGATIHSRDGTNKPYITVEYIPSPNIYVDASPAAGSGLMTDAEFSNPLIVNAEPAEGSALVVDPVVVGEGLPDVTVVAEPGHSMSEMPGGGYSEPIAVEVLFAEGSGEVVEVTVDTTFNAIITPAVFVSEAYFSDPEEARRDIDDPYFRRIVATTDSDDIWFRLDEKSGTKVEQRIGGSGAIQPDDINPKANWNIAPQHSINGPVGRRAVRLDGRQYIDRPVYTGPSFPSPGLGGAGAEFTFEAVIRTTQKDSLLFFGFDPKAETLGHYESRLWIKDGKVALIGPNAYGQSGANVLTGFKDISDGEWHHIVVSWGFGSSKPLDNGMRIYVDGQLDVRRRDDGMDNQRIFVTPDNWFGAPAGMRDWLNLPPNFIGDVMEMTYRYRMDLGMHDIQRLYYDAMGTIPIEIAPFRATGEAIDAKGRGNVKRALMLYFDTGNPITAQLDTKESAMGVHTFPGDFDFGAQIPTPGSPGYTDASSWLANRFFNAGYHFFFASVDRAPNGDWYRDPVTDLPRLADVDKDFDLSSFDLIMYKNWPDDGNEFDRLTRLGFAPDALDKHVESLRRAIDETGISLWVSNPSLGVRLGIVSTVEFISRLRESKFHPNQGLNQYGNWNDHAPVVHPFGRNMAPWSARDTHMNNRERIVSTVEGMTDLPGYVIDDAVIWSIFDPMEGLEQDWSLSFKQRLDGLQIGDEYVEATYWRAEVGRDTDRWVDGGNQYLYGMYAVPASAVLAGTAVTKLGRTHWVEGNKEVPNPYADYVGTIVLQPGDTLKGTPVQSKILFTVGQDPRYATHDGIDDYSIQVVPEDKEPEYMRRWHFSTARWLVGGGGGNVDQGPGAGGGVVAVPNADGTFTFVSGGNKTTWANLIIHENYPRVPIKVPNMVLRGMKWLGDRIVDGPGDSTVRVTPLAGSAEVPEPSVNANRMVRVNVPGPALANGQMKAPEGYSGDMLVLVFPALGSASMTNYVRLIEAGPATGNGVMPDPAEVKARTDSVTLFVRRPAPITLYLEEL